MKQKQANVEEARLARVQIEFAAEQSRAIMVFTIFTIVFLPLSFFSSVFGMNAREWSGTDTNPELGYIVKVMGAASVTVIVVALFMAFNSRARRFVKHLWKRGVLATIDLLELAPSERAHKIADRLVSEGRERPTRSPHGIGKEKLANRARRIGLRKRLTTSQYSRNSLEHEDSEESYEV